MTTPLLATKLYTPSSRSRAVPRPHLTARLGEGLSRKLTLICAPAGFGKTTLLSEWLAKEERPVAWLSLDAKDSDPTRFLAYLVAALRQVTTIGEGVTRVLGSPQPPPTEAVLTPLLNDLAAATEPFTLVLDDYHVIDSRAVDAALTFVLEYLPPHLHLVIATREDPPLPLARLRARGQLSELRATDLRFTAAETADFFESVTELNLSSDDVALLEQRTEGWVAGLQLAALSMQGRQDVSGFIRSFSGSHRFVLDYLLEEVLRRQSERVQDFLLKTSVLERFCAPLCDAVSGGSAGSQQTLESLERANLFIVPLDDERRWYRYHHLFAELLRQRLHQGAEEGGQGVATYHRRASQWLEDNDLELEAFHHAVAANDTGRAARLAAGKGMPLLFRGAVAPVVRWLESLPTSALDARPSLWVMYASALLFVNRVSGVEAKLQAAEAALAKLELNAETKDHLGHIASIRATLAIPKQQVDVILEASHRALALLHPDNLPVRTATTWTLGLARQLQGNRAAAREAFSEAIAKSEAMGHIIITLAATTGLAHIQETETQLHQAAETYRRVLEVAGDPPWPLACEAYLGLARICYEWNDLDAAERYAGQSVHLTRQMKSLDTFASCGVLLARLHLARGDGASAAAALAEAEQFLHEHGFLHRLPMVAAAQVQVLLYQGDLSAAARLAGAHDLPTSRARVHLARSEASTALALLEPLHRQAEAKRWADVGLETTVLQAVAHHLNGEQGKALQRLGEALRLAEPEGFIRTFVDEGEPVAHLLREAVSRGTTPDYVGKLLAAFEAAVNTSKLPPGSLLEPLSERELEVLRLIAQGLSNRAIAERLFRALDTIKGHNRRIYGKLQVKNRTEAVARARELGLL